MPKNKAAQVLAAARWAGVSEQDRKAVGAKLAKARKRISRAKRREIAKAAAKARWEK
jgi:hypothetical protein